MMGVLAQLIAQRIRLLRKEKGLRQEDMERSGISYKYYQRIERGKVNLTLKTIERIAAALEVDPEDIFSLPLGGSKEVDELNSRITELVRENDDSKIRKLNLLIKEIL